jgi:hypothetical protein
MLVVKSRTQARTIGAILNNIAGKKVFKQARTVSPEGWTIPRVKGVLNMPLSCPPRQEPISQLLDGVLVTAKNKRTTLH